MAGSISRFVSIYYEAVGQTCWYYKRWQLQVNSQALRWRRRILPNEKDWIAWKVLQYDEWWGVQDQSLFFNFTFNDDIFIFSFFFFFIFFLFTLIHYYDYLYGKQVLNSFNCNTFKDYDDLYLKIDVHLLADFFEQIQDVCLDSCGLNAAHYYTAPAYLYLAQL